MNEWIRNHIWQIITVVFIAGSMVATDAFLWKANAEDHSDFKSVGKDIRDFTAEQKAFNKGMRDNQELILRMIGLVPLDSIADYWQEFPREPERDSAKNIVCGSEWVTLPSDSLGNIIEITLLRYIDGKIEGRTLWARPDSL